MAAGYHDFVSGEVLTAANLEDYCQNQSVMRFASTAARDTALSAVKTDGMYADTIDTNSLWRYNGSSWVLQNANDWVTVGALSGAWVNVGGSAQVPRYRIWGDTVYIEGHVKSGTTGTTIFTLPSGFRPPLNMTFPTDGSGAYGILSVSSAGAVVGTGTTTTNFSINCHFSTV